MSKQSTKQENFGRIRFSEVNLNSVTKRVFFVPYLHMSNFVLPTYLKTTCQESHFIPGCANISVLAFLKTFFILVVVDSINGCTVWGIVSKIICVK